MRIGILGCGYVGQAAATLWKKAGHTVTATTRQPANIATLQALVDDVFLIQDEELQPFLSQQDVLLISVAPQHKADDYTSTYLHTAQRIVDQLPMCPMLKQILYTSSTSVYGDHQGAWITEDTPPHLLNSHAHILWETEQVLFNQQSAKRNVCIFRLGEIYGPGREIGKRLRASQGQPFPGTGEQYANLIHREDITRALDFALQQRLYGIYNLCQDEHPSRKQLYEQLCQKENLPTIQWNSQQTTRHSGNKRVSNEKIKSLGFTFNHSIIF